MLDEQSLADWRTRYCVTIFYRGWHLRMGYLEILRGTFKSLFSKMTITIWAICSMGAVLAGPFGTYSSMSLSARLFYWPAVVTTSIFLGYLGHAIARMILKEENESIYGQLLGAGFGALLVTSDVWVLTKLFAPFGSTLPSYSTLMGYVGFVFFAVLVSRFGMRGVLQSAGIDRSTIDAQEFGAAQLSEAPNDIPQPPRLVRRLPAKFEGQILRLTADNHFVEVVSECGSTSLRMRLRDAVSEMDGVEGSLVHRSHWVAHEGIQSVEKVRGKLVIRLSNGDEVPVSRSYRASLEAANLPNFPGGASEQSEGFGP